MTKRNLEILSDLLNEYYQEHCKTCNYDCSNCELGVLEGCGYGHSCAVETVIREVNVDLYEMIMSRK